MDFLRSIRRAVRSHLGDPVEMDMHPWPPEAMDHAQGICEAAAQDIARALVRAERCRTYLGRGGMGILILAAKELAEQVTRGEITLPPDPREREVMELTGTLALYRNRMAMAKKRRAA